CRGCAPAYSCLRDSARQCDRPAINTRRCLPETYRPHTRRRSEWRLIRAIHVVHRNALVYRRVWRGSVFSSFVQPTLFLAAMGLGLGMYVDIGKALLPHGVSFLQFLAPGLLAATCMQTASFESSWPVTGKMRWHRNYEATMAT